ncbi:unnamed protein product [Pylaiella littoralis]
MTLTLLFLFSWGLGWSKQKLVEYWQRNIMLAVCTGAGLFVHEVFDEDDELAARALEWMMQFDTDQDIKPTRCFMQPRHVNHPSVSGRGVEEDKEGRGEEECRPRKA